MIDKTNDNATPPDVEVEPPSANTGRYTSVRQYRPRSTFEKLDRAYYCPERDLGHVGYQMVRAAMIALDDKHWEPWFRDFVYDTGVEEAELCNAAKKLAEAMNTIVTTANPVVALEATGFTTLPYEYQMAIYTRIGQVFLAAIWEGVKDLTPPDGEPPKSHVDIINAVDDLMANIGKKQECPGSATSKRSGLFQRIMSALTWKRQA